MLDAYIIDAIREEDDRRRRERDGGRSRLELPLHGEHRRPEPSDRAPTTPSSPEDARDRGVVIIPLSPTVPLRDEDDAA